MKAPHTLDTNTLETVSGGWHGHRWHRGRNTMVINNYWGGAQPVVQQAPQASFSMQMSSSWG